jgi:hypothetical protein
MLLLVAINHIYRLLNLSKMVISGCLKTGEHISRSDIFEQQKWILYENATVDKVVGHLVYVAFYGSLPGNNIFRVVS